MTVRLPLSPAGSRRLQQLVAAFGADLFDDHAVGVGSDPSGAITLEVDPTGWVIDAQVAAFSDESRTPVAFAALVRAAFSAAEAARLLAVGGDAANLEAEVAAGRELVERRRRIDTGPPLEPGPRVTRPEGPVDVVVHGADSTHVGRLAKFVGSSRGREVRVVISVGNGLVALDAEEQWLRDCAAIDAKYALKEAFAAAYSKGEST